MHDMAEVSKRSSNELDDSSVDLSPTDYIADRYFPLKDFELIKIYDYHFKIIDELNNVVKIMDGDKVLEDQMDNSEESMKLKKRAEEYSIRFSRHHLYPFKRSIENIIMFLEINKPFKKVSKEVLRKKLTAAYQSALQGIQSYIAYRSAQNLPVNKKLKEMILLILKYYDISKNLLIPMQKSVGGNIELLADTCNKIVNIIDLKDGERKKLPQRVKKIKKKCKELNVANNLTMYEPKLGDWTMKSQALARLRFGQILKARNNKKFVAKKSVTSFSDRSLKPQVSAKEPKRRVDEVVATDDIQTEIEKFHLNTYRTKENLPKKKQASETSLKTSSVAQDAKKESSTVEKPECSNKNVGFYHFVSETEVKDENQQEEDEEEEEGSEIMQDKVPPTTYPFLPLSRDRHKLTVLSISDDVIRDLALLMNSKYLKESPEDEESWSIISRISDLILKVLIGDILEEVFDDDCIDALYENELKCKR